jgi:hypothetical protein
VKADVDRKIQRQDVCEDMKAPQMGARQGPIQVATP